MIRAISLLAAAASLLAQPKAAAPPAAPAPAAPAKVLSNGPHRMEITLERHDSSGWHVIDPGLVLNQGDQVRFRFKTNFNGFLYVTNQSSSGAYQQLFPMQETGQNNRVSAGQEYQVPSTEVVFTVSGPAGYETVYWLVTPAKLADGARTPSIPSDYKAVPPSAPLTPRCDDTIWRARGDCVDSSAGPKLVPRGEQLPQSLASPAEKTTRDLFFLRQEDKAVISSPTPLSGPVIYEFRLAHR